MNSAIGWTVAWLLGIVGGWFVIMAALDRLPCGRKRRRS